MFTNLDSNLFVLNSLVPKEFIVLLFWISKNYKSIKDHNDAIESLWNDNVSDKDTVLSLGDSVLGAGKESAQVYKELILRLKFKALYLMPGNHMAGWHQLFNLEPGTIDSYYRKQVMTHRPSIYLIPSYCEVFVNNQPIVLSHYPILSWNGMAKNAIMLFGHVHQSLEKTEWVKRNYLIGKTMDVGFEAVKYPISFEAVKEIMDKREVLKVDHH
jgi:calcineurin-like phosphoesterase family protein